MIEMEGTRVNDEQHSARRGMEGAGLPESHMHSEQSDWPVFICYRQADGKTVAELVYRSLHGAILPFTPADYSTPPPTSVYFDQTAPAVSDWTALHGPELQRARTFIFVCTPGAYSRLDEDDWVYRELDWWLEHRQIAPILITSHGERWVPKELQKRWPKAQRLDLDVKGLPSPSDAGYEDLRLRLQSRVLGGIQGTAVQVLYDTVEREKAHTRRLIGQRRALLASLAVAITAALLAGLFFTKSRESTLRAIASERKEIFESSGRLVAQASVLQNDHRPHAAGTFLLQALELAQRVQQDPPVEILKERTWNLFRSLDIRPTVILDGHIEPVQAIDVSLDGRLAATGSGMWAAGHGAVGSQDNSVRLWNLGTNQQLGVLEGHRTAVLRVRFDSTGSTLVSASQDGAIKVWDVPTRTLRCELAVERFSQNVQTIDFSPDGKWFFTGPIHAWDAPVGSPSWWSAVDCSSPMGAPTIEGKALGLLWDHNSPGRMWTVAMRDGKVVAEWIPREAYSPVDPSYKPWAAALSHSGALVAVGPGNDHGDLADASVVLWNATSGQVVRRLSGHKSHVRAVAFSPDDRLLASGDEDGFIWIWDVATGREQVKLEGHSGAIRSVAFGPGSTLLSGATDGTLRRWLLPRQPMESQLKGRAWRVAVTRDRSHRFQTNRDGGDWLEKRDAASDALVHRVQADVSGLAVSALHPLIVTEEDRQVVVRDADSLQVVHRLPGPFGHFESLAIGGQSAMVASSDPNSAYPQIRVWDVATGDRITTIDRGGSGDIAMTPDGRLLAGGCGASKVCFWDPRSGQDIAEYSFNESAAGAREETANRDRVDVTISPDGQTMFFVCSRGIVVVWDIESREALATRLFDPGVAIAPLDRTRLVVASKSELQEWDFRSNVILQRWTASKVVTGLAPGADSRSVVGLVDGFGLLEWRLPLLELPATAPNSKTALNPYYDLVGMRAEDDTWSGRVVVPRVVEPSEERLLTMLNDADVWAQRLALAWLARARTARPSLMDRVEQLLGSPDSRVREAAVMALSRRGVLERAKAASAIAPMLRDDDVEVRTAALFALDKFGSDASVAVPQLRELLRTADDYSEHLGAHYSPSDVAGHVLASIGPAAAAAVPDLIRVIREPVPEHQRPPASCVRALGAIGDARPEVVQALLGALEHPEVNMRYQAAIALGELPVASSEITSALEAAAEEDPHAVPIATALERVRGRMPEGNRLLRSPEIK